MEYTQYLISIATLIGYYLVTSQDIRGHWISMVASICMVVQFYGNGMYGYAILNTAFAFIAIKTLFKHYGLGSKASGAIARALEKVLA